VEAIAYIGPSEEVPKDGEGQAAANGNGLDVPGTDKHAAVGRPRQGLSVLNIWVDMITGRDVLAALSHCSIDRPRHLCYVNAHSLNLAHHDESYRGALARADLVLNDGIGLDLAARMRGRSFPENLNGSDFTLRLLSLAEEKAWRVYLYGGRPGVAAMAGDRLCAAMDRLKIVGVRDGYKPGTCKEVVDDIRAAAADVVIVALGQPEQELWLDTHLAETGCHLGVGVGAFFDFASGRVVRAPQWMNRLGVEWVFRLVREPGRLWRRYIIGNPVFLWRAWRLRTGDAAIDASRVPGRATDLRPPLQLAANPSVDSVRSLSAAEA
jgi:exopolysaccharide biosynthesis WecB/TagA/CpsF family protein